MEKKGYTIYSVITTLLEEVALAAVVIWLLPRFEINIPLWGLILMMVALGAYDYMTYRFGKRALDKKPIIHPPEVGSMGKAATPLTPKGYVRVGSELWKALATSSIIDKDEEVVIVGIKGLTVLVAPLDNGNHKSNEESKYKTDMDKAKGKSYPYVNGD